MIKLNMMMSWLQILVFHKTFTNGDLVNKLLISKISSIERTSMQYLQKHIFVKAYEKQSSCG